MKRFVDDNKTYHILYENISEFFELTDSKNPPETMHEDNKDSYREITSDEDKSWRYGSDKSHEGYLKNRFDSTNGKKLCADEVSKVVASREYKKLIQQALTYRQSMRFEDHGHRINIPKAISGEDRYFTVYKNTKRPTVKIAINGCGSACVDAEDFIRLAKTAVPTIYALEMAGIATEVYYTAFARNTFNRGSDPSTTHLAVKIKSAQERFNWTNFAPVFSLGSYRESIFLSWIYSEFEVSCGLGRPMDRGDMEERGNFGYTSIIGINAPGPMEQVGEVFASLGKKNK